MRTALIGLALLAMAAASAPACAMTLDELIDHCAAGDGSDAGVNKVTRCIGYIDGIIDGHEVSVTVGGGQRIFCGPSQGIAIIDAILALASWTERNPKDWQRPARSGVFMALMEKYPCKR